MPYRRRVPPRADTSTRRHIDASTANRPKWRSGVAAWRRMTEDSGIPARRGSPRHAAPYRAERPPQKNGAPSGTPFSRSTVDRTRFAHRAPRHFAGALYAMQSTSTLQSITMLDCTHARAGGCSPKYEMKTLLNDAKSRASSSHTPQRTTCSRP
ncbi:hypothetical protein DP42_4540 [Burkholderia pseudomallei]|nr:hypothetical protein DP42_4540 [Burkholderia pseudomallei]